MMPASNYNWKNNFDQIIITKDELDALVLRQKNFLAICNISGEVNWDEYWVKFFNDKKINSKCKIYRIHRHSNR